MPERRHEPGGRADRDRGAGLNAKPKRWMTNPGLGPKRDDKMEQVLYFAYGSNLDDGQMRARCASARPVARAVLPNYALAFGGFSHRWGGAVASVLRAQGARVEGLLYELDGVDLRVLDRYEGHPFAYERVIKLVRDEHGRRRRAAVYLQPERDFEPWAPPPGYVGVMRRAYRRLGFDVVPLVRAAQVQP